MLKGGILINSEYVAHQIWHLPGILCCIGHNNFQTETGKSIEDKP